jgi:hypothetical protein
MPQNFWIRALIPKGRKSLYMNMVRKRFHALSTYTVQPDWPQHDRLCCRPAVFFGLLRLSAVSLQQGKFGALFKNIISFLLFFPNP